MILSILFKVVQVKWIWATMILVGLLLNVILLYRTQLAQEALYSHQENIVVWSASQNEIEYLKLQDRLGRIGSPLVPATADQVRESFELFWSRIALYRQGVHASTIEAHPSLRRTVEAVSALLAELDPAMASLSDGQRDVATEMRDRLEAQAAALRAFSLQILADNVQNLRDQDAAHKASVAYLAGAGLFLVIGLAVVISLLILAERKAVRSQEQSKRAAAEAARASRHLSDAIGVIGHGFALFDAADRLEVANAGYRALYGPISHRIVPGIAFEEILRAAVAAGLYPDWDDADSLIADVRSKRKRGNVRHMIVKIDGERTVRFVNHPTDDGGIVTIGEDLTEQLRTEDKIAGVLALKESILQSAMDCFVSVDAEMRIIQFNPAAERTFGYPASAALGRNMTELIIPDKFRAAHDSGVVRWRQTGEAPVLGQRLELEAKRSDGALFPIEIAIVKAEVAGQPIFTAYIRDISERKNAEAQLRAAREAAEKASNAKSEFIANMSHEMRTPLNAVLGMSSLLVRSELDRDQERFVRTIIESGQSLLYLINDVLDLSKLEAGRLTLESEPFELGDLVEGTIDLVAAQASAKGIRMGWSVEPDPGQQVVGDSGRVRQILLNLLSNAVKFTSQGSIFVSIRSGLGEAGKEFCRFEVRDTGIGIDAQSRDVLFERFSQIDHSTTRRYGGAGLGLAIAKLLVDAMDGTIGVDSVPGKGSTFWFELALPRCGEDGAQAGHRFETALVIGQDPDPTVMAVLSRLAGRTATAAAIDRVAESPARDSDVIVLHVSEGVGQAMGQLAVLKSSLSAARNRVLAVLPMLHNPTIAAEFADACRGVLQSPVSRRDLVRALSNLHGAPSSPAEGRTVAERSALRILLAEDNMANQRVMEAILNSLGHQAVLVGNGDEAVKAAADSTYDLILLDVQMPVMGGDTACKAIRQGGGPNAASPIYAITAAAMTRDRVRFTACGFTDVITKPITFEKIERLLQDVASRAETDPLHHQQGHSVRAPSSEALDERTVVALAGAIGNEKMADLLAVLEGDLNQAVGEIRQAVAAGHEENLKAVAHRLKGMAATFGLQRIADDAAMLEQYAGPAGNVGLNAATERLLATALDDFRALSRFVTTHHRVARS